MVWMDAYRYDISIAEGESNDMELVGVIDRQILVYRKILDDRRLECDIMFLTDDEPMGMAQQGLPWHWLKTLYSERMR